jgi:hypothetical protein
MRAVRVASVSLLAWGLTAGLAAAQTEEPVPAGTWTFVPEESDRISDAIDQAVAHMNFLVRGVARSRLRGANQPIDRIVIRYPDDQLYVSLHEDAPPVVTPRSGTAPYTRRDGEVVRVTTEFRDGAIRHFFDSDDGDKEHIYRFRPDGTLALEVTVLSERLREPFRYTWVFRR